MAKPNRSNIRWIWLSALILFVCVAATTIAFVSRLNGFLLDDSGAICLMTANTSATDDRSAETGGFRNTGYSAMQAPAAEQEPVNSSETLETQTDPTTAVTAPQAARPLQNPGFEASDDQTVWSTNTQVEIFRISYENGEQVITVHSDDGDQVIAPGTENSYTFKLKNTGNVALDYSVAVDAYFTPVDIEIPITGRLNRYDGTWVVGGKDSYASVSGLDAAEDKATLGPGKYTYYTLDWLWPFESENDEYDTMLGNLAVEQDLIFTIVIKTNATESSNPYDDSGITPPKTGDGMNLALWIVLMVSSFVMMLFLLFYQSRDKRRYSAEANQN